MIEGKGGGIDFSPATGAVAIGRNAIPEPAGRGGVVGRGTSALLGGHGSSGGASCTRTDRMWRVEGESSVGGDLVVGMCDHCP